MASTPPRRRIFPASGSCDRLHRDRRSKLVTGHEPTTIHRRRRTLHLHLRIDSDELAKCLPRGFERVGHSDNEKCDITVSGELAPDLERETVLHELLHVAWYQTPLGDMFDAEQQERVVLALSPRIFGLLRDNPLLVAYLTA